MLGGTEYVAEAIEEKLNENGHQTILHLQPEFDQIATENQIWLICTSTHGAGELPDNIQAFARDLQNSAKDLSTTPFLIVGVGDSSYDTFCQAAKTIENNVLDKNGWLITERFELDMSKDIDPEDEAQNWIDRINDQL
jgi:MioC protein